MPKVNKKVTISVSHVGGELTMPDYGHHMPMLLLHYAGITYMDLISLDA